MRLTRPSRASAEVALIDAFCNAAMTRTGYIRLDMMLEPLDDDRSAASEQQPAVVRP